MQDFILSGQAIDVVLLVIVIEFVILVALRRKVWKRTVVDLIFALMPGALLLIAVRFALTGADWTWIALAIALSFPFHLIDLVRRHQSETAPPQ
ncbi:MAG: hypothetical protein Q8R82_08990 [Hyphomonadaceae bacterium]|nr:hypothetical protein [Hyphomonadaceae bacterium]